MSFELKLLLSFPREVFTVAPPVPITKEQAPKVHTQAGDIFFYFDDWDVLEISFDSFVVHFVPASVPDQVQQLLELNEGPHVLALFGTDTPEIAQLRQRVSILTSRSPEAINEWQTAQNRLQDLSLEHGRRVESACDSLFQDPVYGPYFRETGRIIMSTTASFLRVLKVKYGQYILPDNPPSTTAANYWMLRDSTRRVSDGFLSRLLGLRTWADPNDSKPLLPNQWNEIAQLVENGYEPAFSEILLASARGLCDPELGSPRLAMIEAVVALEIEIKKLMTIRLRGYGVSKSTVDRIVRETPLADLASVWIRREVAPDDPTIDDDVYRRCADAIHERNELIHHERRTIDPKRAREHIVALSQLIGLACRLREHAQ